MDRRSDVVLDDLREAIGLTRVDPLTSWRVANGHAGDRPRTAGLDRLARHGRQTVHSHYVAAPGVLIDPMPPDGEPPGAPRLVVLTNRHHVRHAAEYDCPIRCHQAGPQQFGGAEFDVQGFAFGDELAPGVRALEVGVLCPEETALHIAAGDGFLAFADAIVRDDDGNLAFVADHLLGDDPEPVKAGLRDAFARLLDEQAFDGLLLTHGDPTRKRRARRTRALRQWMSTGVPTGTR